MSNVETIEYGGKEWRRYPDSRTRTHRVYFQRHEHWKEPPVFLHRKIYEDNFGRIPNGYHVHHKDGNPLNNSPDNLEALPAKVHNRLTQEYYKSNAEWVEKQKKRFSSESWRNKVSNGQKNRVKKRLKCQLCGESFMSRAYNSKWCNECKSMQYSDRNGLHFNSKKQLERFGEIRITYSEKV